MRPGEVVRRVAGYLARHDVASPRATAEVLLAHVLGTDRAHLYARSESLTPREARLYCRALCQRCRGTPVQHLTGEQAFRRLSIEVRPGVFVPRPETEVLVGAALEAIEKVEAPVVVDVGTGTGAIALAIKEERPDSQVLATDLSPEAAALARHNAEALGLDVRVLDGDLLAPVPEELRGWVDLVVSNPPYVTPEEYEDLPAEVRGDPELALLGGIDVYRRLAAEALRWLDDGGVLAVEIGAAMREEVVAVLEADFMEVGAAPDLAGRDRVVVGRRP